MMTCRRSFLLTRGFRRVGSASDFITFMLEDMRRELVMLPESSGIPKSATMK